MASSSHLDRGIQIETGRHRASLEIPKSPLDEKALGTLRAISPRPEAGSECAATFFENNHPFPEAQLEVPGGETNYTDIDGIEDMGLPPVMEKQFQRKPSTRAWQFREILDDMKNGLFENPSSKQLDELWNCVDSDNNGVLDSRELTIMIERYILLCQVIAKKQIQKHQSVMKRMGGTNHRRMSMTLGKLASQTQVICNQWINQLHKDPESLTKTLMNDLMDENSEWTREEFYRKAPAALRKLKMELKMHEWSDRAAELINLAEAQSIADEEELEEEGKKSKKRLEGILTIKVVGALDLKPEEGRKTCSPYCILHVGNKKLPTIFLQNTNNPEWSQKFRFTRYRFKFGQSRQGTLYVMDWNGEQNGASLVGFADFKIPDNYVEDAQQIELTLKDNNENNRGYLTITLSLQPKRPEYNMSEDNEDEDERKPEANVRE